SSGTTGVSGPSGSGDSVRTHLPERTLEKTSLLPSGERFCSHASTPDEVMGCPGPVTLPCVASKGVSQARTCCDSSVKASRFRSGEREKSVPCPGLVVTRSIEIARKVWGSTAMRHMFLAPRKVRSKYIALPEGAQENLKSSNHSNEEMRPAPLLAAATSS